MAEQIFELGMALMDIHNERRRQLRDMVDGKTMDVDMVGFYDHHGDIKADSILWFEDKDDRDDRADRAKSNDRLVLTGVGLGKLNRKYSRSGVDPKMVHKSSTYKAPEFDLRRGKISILADIFSFGCLCLEFVTWYLEGWDSVSEIFPDYRLEEDIYSQESDIFFTLQEHTKEGETAIIKPKVREWISRLRKSKHTSAYILQFLELIEEQMLEPEANQRIRIYDLVRELELLAMVCRRNPRFYEMGSQNIRHFSDENTSTVADTTFTSKVDTYSTAPTSALDSHGHAQLETVQDSRSVISAFSEAFNEGEKNGFALLMYKTIRENTPNMSNLIGTMDSQLSAQHQIEAELKAFVETMKPKFPGKTEKTGLKAIYYLRNDIAKLCRDALLPPEQQEALEQEADPRPIFPGLPEEMGHREKVARFLDAPGGEGSAEEPAVNEFSANNSPPHEDESSNTSTESGLDELFVRGINVKEVIGRFAADPAFEALALGIEDAVRFADDTLSMIQHRVSSALKRIDDPMFGSEFPKARFQICWNLEDYLRDNYDDPPDLSNILATTGVLAKAQLCTVGEYFQQVEAWKPHCTELLQALREALDKRNPNDSAPQTVSTLTGRCRVPKLFEYLRC